ncbi:V-type proton ATPase subunit C 1-B-like [Dendronephthya gigantea]|uniref:V-type proton ATPase subunit C 1-B-like n=1 Tax=Dendronephthya gigantea TaxID=151771 RepID=UPI001068D5A0|nr:V-type proton ATPase subunit C 1-B-like [Dendronephthya gigantea]
MSEYWLISVPGDNKEGLSSWDRLKTQIGSLSNIWKFHIPSDLKVGTLDTLIGLSDELHKLDIFVEGITKKVASYMVEIANETEDGSRPKLKANGCELNHYTTNFQWDVAKYPLNKQTTLRNIAEIIGKQVTQIDNDLKTKATAYNSVKTSLASLERKATGPLITRNLGDIVKRENFILDSEYLTTLLVIVPCNIEEEWKKKYWKLCDMVVPNSTEKLYTDGDFALYNVCLFQKVVEEFKLHARENKFIVREFVYNEEALAAGKNELNKLESDKKKQLGPLKRWLHVNFGEAFTAWIHVKALRLFVESVLRYGLPVNFQAMILEPQKKMQKKIRDILYGLYSHLDNQINDSKGEHVDIPGLTLGPKEYYPYVWFQLKINILESRPL